METQSFGSRAGRAFTRLIVILIVLALFGAVAFLLSQLNARTYSLEAVDGKLVVMKGKLLPLGSDPFRPSDPRMADAYAPIPLEGRSPGALATQRFTDRDELDRALFAFLKDSASAKIASDDPKSLNDGLGMLQRMEKLAGITEDQRATLKRMEAEVAFDQARMKLDDARRLIASAVEQLKLAADSRTRHAEAAHEMVSEVEPAANQFEQVLRRAVHTVGGGLVRDEAPSQQMESPAPQRQNAPGRQPMQATPPDSDAGQGFDGQPSQPAPQPTDESSKIEQRPGGEPTLHPSDGP
jgi:hypothetical protein